MIRLSAFFVVALLASSSFAETVTVEVTIEQVKAESRGIIVAYMIGGEKKTTTLDVSRRAEITLNGTTCATGIHSAGPEGDGRVPERTGSRDENHGHRSDARHAKAGRTHGTQRHVPH